jgi:transposase
MTHTGVGALTARALLLKMGEANRFSCGKQIASYLVRYRQKTPVTVRSDPSWRNQFFYLAMGRGRKIAKVAMARRLAVRLF